MQAPNHNEVIDNMTLYLSEMFQDAEDNVTQKFIEVVGSDDPTYWEKEGYDMLDIHHSSLDTNELVKHTRVLRKGESYAITAVQVIMYPERIETKPLDREEAQNLLNKRRV